MINKINITTFLDSVDLGVSRPILVLGDDFNEYILKNQRIDNNGTITKFDCMFLNEMLAFQIAKYLGIPIPDIAIAHLDKSFIDEYPEYRFTHRLEEGIYFSTKKLDNVENNLIDNMNDLIDMGKNYSIKSWNSFLKKIDNHSSIAGIIAFDRYR